MLELLTLPLIILNDDGLCYHLIYWQVRQRWWWPLQAINLKPFNHSILVLSSLHLFNWIKFHSCIMEKYYRWYNFVNVYLTRAFFDVVIIVFIFQFLKRKDNLTWNRNLFASKSNPVENRIQVQRNLSCGRDAKNETMKS